MDTVVAVDNDGPEPLMKSVSDTQGEETLHATEDIFIKQSSSCCFTQLTVRIVRTDPVW